MRSRSEIAREFSEAKAVLVMREAEEIVAREGMADRDVRTAQVTLACTDEIQRVNALAAELSEVEAHWADRWIEAHEALAFIRRATSQS